MMIKTVPTSIGNLPIITVSSVMIDCNINDRLILPNQSIYDCYPELATVDNVEVAVKYKDKSYIANVSLCPILSYEDRQNLLVSIPITILFELITKVINKVELE